MRNWEPRSKEGFWWGFVVIIFIFILIGRKMAKFANLK